MKLVQDSERFDEYQVALIKEITQAIAVKLVEAGLHGELMENTTANIAFSVASILDDTTRIEAGEDEVHPYLTFRSGESQLIHCGENAYTYEFLTGILKEMFEGQG
jgi:hypothetical protein